VAASLRAHLAGEEVAAFASARQALIALTATVATAVAVTGCTDSSTSTPGEAPSASASPSESASASSAGGPTSGQALSPDTPSQPPATGAGVITLGFAGDVHFERQLGSLLREPLRPASRLALGDITTVLRQPDLMMLNLEAAITRRGTPEPKEYQFRASPTALRLLDAAGVDLVTMANNHAVDYGRMGLRDTLAAIRTSPVPVVGVGPDARAAWRPHTTAIRGTTVAVFGASTKPDRTAKVWSAGPAKAGVAIAIAPRQRLLRAVGDAARTTDVVVAYLHWGQEYQACPTGSQLRHARALAAAGADVVVGSHAHVLLGSGWLDDTYVNYGLGNFLWYNQNSIDTGILQLRVRDGEVVDDSWTPARIQPDGRPRVVPPPARAAAIADWRRLQVCAAAG
jgi:poly-gamma-glutamate synthesis protein (capsule biosynthesis protein)